jgi:hypothetical protein
MATPIRNEEDQVIEIPKKGWRDYVYPDQKARSLESIFAFIAQRNPPAPGNRNAFAFRFAAWAFDEGHGFEEVIRYLADAFGVAENDPEVGLRDTVRSAQRKTR